MEHIGIAAGVPIEPESQKKLADMNMQIPGVLISGVPGAGGYDAIFCLLLSERSSGNNWSCDPVLSRIEESWRQMSQNSDEKIPSGGGSC